MKRNWWTKFTFLLVVALVSVVSVVPTIFDHNEESNYPVKSKISLGLDLQGGLYMILGIDFQKVYRDEMKNYASKMRYILSDREIKATIGSLDTSDDMDPKHSIIIDSTGNIEEAKKELKAYFQNVLRLTGGDGTTLTYALADSMKQKIEETSVTKSIEVIRNRIDEFGVTEPEIVSQGNDRIIVALPGVKDIDRAKSLIGKTAKLEFKLVNNEVAFQTIASWVDKAEKSGIVYKTGTRFSDYIHAVNDYLKDDLPKGYELSFQKQFNKLTNELTSKTPYLVESTPQLTGDDLEDASVQIDQQKNEPIVAMNFKSQGAERFETLTAENVGRQLAVILDGNVYTAPNINGRIPGGRATITMGYGDFNTLMKQARDVALVLRAGALPVQLDFLEQRTVGPSLGADSIEKARYAGLVGSVLVFLFILIYYKVSGAIAIVTLSLNILFVLAALVGLEATLTLPGIAGIALTVGMAVDANIIIYERIREEVRKGVGFYKAVESGFSQAFWTIIDANVTTALAGFCLLNFGTGPIRGFAVTLLIGIIATVYTSYFVGKMLFEFYLNKVEGQDLSI